MKSLMHHDAHQKKKVWLQDLAIELALAEQHTESSLYDILQQLDPDDPVRRERFDVEYPWMKRYVSLPDNNSLGISGKNF